MERPRREHPAPAGCLAGPDLRSDSCDADTFAGADAIAHTFTRAHTVSHAFADAIAYTFANAITDAITYAIANAIANAFPHTFADGIADAYTRTDEGTDTNAIRVHLRWAAGDDRRHGASRLAVRHARR